MSGVRKQVSDVESLEILMLKFFMNGFRYGTQVACADGRKEMVDRCKTLDD